MELVASFEEAAFADTAGIHGLFFEVANNFIWRFGHVSGHVQQFSKKKHSPASPAFGLPSKCPTPSAILPSWLDILLAQCVLYSIYYIVIVRTVLLG